jgi:beta-phosphoglucomutase
LFQAVIFDFDGVIVDSEPLHYRAIQAALALLDISFPYDEYLRRYVGFDDRDAFREALRSAGRPAGGERVEGLCRLKAAAFRQLLDGDIPQIPGAADLVRSLHVRGVPLAVASGALEAEIRLVLERLGLVECFAVIVSADQVAASKPDPATYRLAVEGLAAAFPGHGIVPAACLAIEDTACGAASARAAGLRVLALATTTAPVDLAAADWILPNLEGVSVDALLAGGGRRGGGAAAPPAGGKPEEQSAR